MYTSKLFHRLDLDDLPDIDYEWLRKALARAAAEQMLAGTNSAPPIKTGDFRLRPPIKIRAFDANKHPSLMTRSDYAWVSKIFSPK